MRLFDDNIKSRAGEFQLEPRPPVWDRIEKELDEKKRRRPLLWLWWMLPLLIAGGTVLHLNLKPLQKSAPQPADKMQSGVTNPPIADDLQNKPVRGEKTPGITAHQKPQQKTYNLQADAVPEKVYRHKGTLSVMEPSSAIITSTKTGPVATDENIAGNTDVVKKQVSNSNDVLIPAGSALADSLARQPQQPVTGATEESAGGNNGLEKALVDTANLMTQTMDQNPVAGKLQPARAGKIKQAKVSGGTWNLLAGMGLHNIGNQQLRLRYSAREFNNGLANFNNSITGSLGNPVLTLEPPKAGPGFLLGIERQQMLGKNNRWSLNAGLHYQYQSVSIRTGARRDSVLANLQGRYLFYLPGTSEQHTGVQHRIHLLGAIQYHMGKKRSWTLQNGFYGGMVLAQDYLLPYAAQTGWISSREQTSAGYLGIETGIRFKPKALGIGIYGQYNLSSSLKTNILSEQYWRGVELRVSHTLSSK